MFLIAEPSESRIAEFIERQRNSPFSYAEIGATRNNEPPVNYNVDHNRARLGFGREAYDQAVAAIRHWKMFDFSWLKLFPDNAPIETGSAVAIVVRHFGFWSLNAARIVYVLEETSETVEKYGFAYGTLSEHAESGEERFSVEYHKSDQSVWYDLYAFSRPYNFFARLGYPASRMLQKQFAVESKAAMQRAVKK